MKIDQEDLELPYAGDPTRVIRVRITRPEKRPGRLPGVLVVHGFKGFLRWGFFPELQERLAAAGFQSVAVNLSGSGVGPDLENFTEERAFYESTPSRDVEDLDTVLEALRGERIGGVDMDRLGIVGHSCGAATALLHAERRGAYRALVSWASVAKTNRFDRSTRERWREDGVLEVRNARIGKIHRMGLDWLNDVEENTAQLDIQAACARSCTPTLLIHGDADEAVPLSNMHDLHGAFAEGVAQACPIQGAGHTFGAVHPWQGTTPWLEQALGATLDFLEPRLLGKADS